MKRQILLTCSAMILALIFMGGMVWATDQKPNILVVWSDDIGQSNISAYTMGLVGYRTPNIDRIAEEGIIFTDYYGEQSCTADRCFILAMTPTGQIPGAGIILKQ